MEKCWEIIHCENKARTGHSIASATDFGNQTHIHKLSDGLLIEILSRIRSYESVIRCKCVSKRWLGLISNNFFTLQFLSHQHNRNSAKPLPFALIFNYEDREERNPVLVYSSDHPAQFGSSGFSFHFLRHYCSDRGYQFVPSRLEAACGDLVLISLSKRRNPVVGNPEFDFEGDYVICNPRTKQWVCLPSLPCSSTMRSKLALVCDPFYSFDRDSCFQESHRYRVISAPLAALGPEIPVDVFSSETGQWSKLGIYCPEGLQGCLHTGVSPVMYNGMLHFLHTSHIFAFDPFVSEKDSVVACRVIGFPVANVDLPRFSFLGTCSEFLRLSTGQWIDRSKCMSVWDLEDYDQGEWCLKFQFSLEDLKVSCAAYLYSKFDYMDDIDILRLLGFHPYDRDILYLLVPDFVVVYNMRTRIS